MKPDVGDLQVQRFQPRTPPTTRWYQAALTEMRGEVACRPSTPAYSGEPLRPQGRHSLSDYTDYSIHYDNAFGSGHYWVDSAGNPLSLPLQSIIGRDQFWKDRPRGPDRFARRRAGSGSSWAPSTSASRTGSSRTT